MDFLNINDVKVNLEILSLKAHLFPYTNKKIPYKEYRTITNVLNYFGGCKWIIDAMQMGIITHEQK